MNTMQANRLGIARTFQNIRLFSNMTVEDNVRIGLHNQVRYGMFTGIFRLPGYWKQEQRPARAGPASCCPSSACRIMADVKAGSLPYGAQRRLEIVRALATASLAAAAGRARRRHEPPRDRGAACTTSSRSAMSSRSP